MHSFLILILRECTRFQGCILSDDEGERINQISIVEKTHRKTIYELYWVELQIPAAQ